MKDDDDDDMAFIWRAQKEASQQKRAENRENSASILKENGIEFTEHNLGAHLVVKASAKTVDFWPGTGKWIVRGGGKTSRGVYNLIKLLKEKNER